MTQIDLIQEQPDADHSEVAPVSNGSQASGSRRQAVLSSLIRRSLASKNIDRLTLDAAALSAETLGVASFGVAKSQSDDGPISLRLVNSTSSDQDNSEHAVELDVDASRSLHGYAVELATAVASADLAIEHRFQDFQLRQAGVNSALVCPMAYGGEIYGLMGVYHDEPREFTLDEVQFMESISQLIATTIARTRTETELRKSREFAESLMTTSEAMVVVLDADGRLQRINRACELATGFTPAEAQGRPIWSAFLIPEDVGIVREGFEQLRRRESPARFETFILTKHGERRRANWSFTATWNAGKVESFVGTAIDVTESFDLADQLERAESAALEARRTLEEMRPTVDSSDGAPAPVESVTAEQEETEILSDSIGRDRRSQARRSYPYIQVVAPMMDGKLPDRANFHEVRCRDISPRGFSFLVPKPPQYTSVVVAFGTHPQLVYLTAEVRHITPHVRDGRTMYLVGCIYTGRAAY